MRERPGSVASPPSAAVRAAIGRIVADGGWWPFDRFMAFALYEPGLGYYARGERIFGRFPEAGSDFVTAPEMSPLFGQALAAQVAQALVATGTAEVWEFGAGSGALAAELLATWASTCRATTWWSSPVACGPPAPAAGAWADRVTWHAALPGRLDGVVLGNEVLDAMPVQLLHFDGTAWFERGVAVATTACWPGPTARPACARRWTRPSCPAPSPRSTRRPSLRAHAGRAAGRGAGLLHRLRLPGAEYYHPQRHGGTLMCHRAHRADTDPLADVGDKDITAHVNFTGIALAAQDAGLDVLGYTSQARFLLNCGLPALLATADLRDAGDGAAAASTNTRWASSSRSSAWPRAVVRRPRLCRRRPQHTCL
jgi:SAM-dependent MidA family methyltransferase